MKQMLRRALSLLLALVLTAGLCTTALAVKYPDSYWPLQDEWIAADAAQDPARVIAVAQKIYDLLMPYGLDADVCNNLEPKCQKAAWCCEMQGAITWLERQRELDQWMNSNGIDKKDMLATSERRLAFLKNASSPKIFALTQNASPYSTGPSLGTWQGSVHEGSQNTGSAELVYIDFLDSFSANDPEYWIRNYNANSPRFAQAAQGGVMEIAWNFTQGPGVVVSASDAQISAAVAAISNIGCSTVLLRLGAEMNNVASCDPAVFQQAFKRIADEAHKYPNINVVFSPNDVGLTLFTKLDDYYPGDQYVDWVGVSTYHNSNYSSRMGTTGTYTYDDSERCNSDAFYNEGVYDSDPLMVIEPIAAFAKAHNKPMMISECGFGYQSASDESQNAYAVDQLNKFYTYVNMVYPQVKAVFYFDRSVSGEAYRYTLADNSAISNAYASAISGNPTYLSPSRTSAGNWQELNQAGTLSGKLRFATYASFPGKGATTVQYFVDGKADYSTSTIPYTFEPNLTPGKHTIRAEATHGNFKTVTAEYEVTVAEAPVTGFQPDSAAEWARPQMQQAHDAGLLTSRTENRFSSQITRLQFADLVVNLTEKVLGQSITPVASGSFTDTDDEAVRKANAAGIAGGKGEGRFDPNGSITRQEICIMLSNAVSYIDAARGTSTLSNTSTAIDEKFIDRDAVASWAQSQVALMTNNNIMTGRDNGIAPLDNTTIQEAVILILRMNGLFA